MYRTFKFTKALTILVIAILFCMYIGVLVMRFELALNFIALISIMVVLYFSFCYGKLAGIVLGLITGLLNNLLLIDYSILHTSISTTKILGLFKETKKENLLQLVFMPVMGFLVGKYVEASKNKIIQLENSVDSLDNAAIDMNTRLNEYNKRFEDLSMQKVYKRSWDNFVNNNQRVEQIIGLLVSQVLESKELNTSARYHIDKLSSDCFRFLLSVKPEILAIMNLNGEITLYNETIMALYGYTSSDMVIGKNIIDFVIPSDTKRASKTIENYLLSGQNLREKYTLKTRDGRIAGQLLLPEITFTGAGSPLSLVACASSSSTSFKQTEIFDDDKTAFTVAQLVQKSICCISIDFKIIFINQKAAELFGYSTDYMIGEKIDSFFSLDNLSLLKEFIYLCKDGNRRAMDIEVLTMERKRTLFRIDAFPSLDIMGCYLDTILFIEDITERKLVEEALKHRLGLEQMITNISTRFIAVRADELDNEITNALRMFGDFEDAKISYVEIYPSDKIKVKKQYRVTNDENMTASLEDDLETVYIPIVIESEPAGFFRFYHQKYFHNWFEHDLELIKLVGEIMINALIRKNNELNIKLNENRLYTTLHSIGDAVIATDTEGLVIMLNKKAEDLTGWTNYEAINKPLNSIFNITIEISSCSNNQDEDMQKQHYITQTYDSVILKSKTEAEIYVSVTRTKIEDNNGEVYGEVIIFRDITQKKLEDDEIRYISFHDKLTGLYNRTFFEEEIARLNTKRQYPITLIIGDCNGLKIANDVFGHLEGDKLLQKVATILKTATRKEDIVARWGGDEFAIILPKTDEQTATSIRERILNLCMEEEKSPIQPSLALGSATKTDDTEDIVGVLKLAEDRMYRHKLLEGKSARNAIITSIEKMIYEKSYETEEHAKRLIDISNKIGNAIGLADYELEELSLLSVLHDMGKIGIPDSILMKSEKLNEAEWELMKKHSEKGYNIAKSTPELTNIADSILHHHEHWDGSGYPAGLKGDSIPKLSRLLSIMDAYDVITHSRSYKNAQSNEEALSEIKRCGGTQFDPELSEIFVQVMSKE